MPEQRDRMQCPMADCSGQVFARCSQQYDLDCKGVFDTREVVELAVQILCDSCGRQYEPDLLHAGDLVNGRGRYTITIGREIE